MCEGYALNRCKQHHTSLHISRWIAPYGNHDEGGTLLHNMADVNQANYWSYTYFDTERVYPVLLSGRIYGKILPLSYSVPHSAFKFLRIFFANGSLISICRGTASTTPVLGLIQREWDAPSRFR